MHVKLPGGIDYVRVAGRLGLLCGLSLMQCVRRVAQEVAMFIDRAALRGHVGPQRRQDPLQPSRAVRDEELRRPQAAPD